MRNYVIVYEMGELWRTLRHFEQLSEAQEFIRRRGGAIRSFCFFPAAVGLAIAIAIEHSTPRPRLRKRRNLAL